MSKHVDFYASISTEVVGLCIALCACVYVLPSLRAWNKEPVALDRAADYNLLRSANLGFASKRTRLRSSYSVSAAVALFCPIRAC
ncbi:hypothetical protein TETAUR1a_000089 [Candidatus Hodgkinia cicadicola]|nr:hypothetical protein TETAUR1a_000089 [Candidatus Hodgkinia cicadicola]